MLPIHRSTSASVLQAPAADPHLSDTDSALAQAFNAVSDGLIDLQASGIGDTLKLIFGQDHDRQHVPERFADYMASQPPLSPLLRDRLRLPYLRILTAFYAGLWQGNAFRANGDFDIDGLTSFVSHYLGASDDWATNCLASEVGQCHFDAIKRFGPVDDDSGSRSGSHSVGDGDGDGVRVLSICDSVGGEIALPGPMLALFATGGRYDGLYLANISLKGQTLTNIHFADSNLRGANLSCVVFDHVRFGQCCIDGAVFDQATLTAVDIDTTTADRVNFTQCSITGGLWSASNFYHAGFDRTQVDGLTCVACNFSATRFSGPRRAPGLVSRRLTQDPRPVLFQNMAIRRSNLDAADFFSVVAERFSLDTSTCHRATFIDNQFSALHLTGGASGALFERNQFRSCCFSGMDAKNSRWQDAEFDASCTFVKADFTDSTLRNVTFSSLAFDGVRFSRARLRNIHFFRTEGFASFVSASFDRAIMEHVIFRQCMFAHAHFVGTRLGGSQFDACDLQGVLFRDAVGLDVVSAAGENNLSHVPLAGVRGGLADWTLADLETPEGRARVLSRQRQSDGMMARIMRVANYAIRTDWVLAMASYLERKGAEATDADASMLSVMLPLAEHRLAPTLASRPSLERHIRTLLIRQIPVLNNSGLTSAGDGAWAIQAAERIGVLLSNFSDVAQWRQLSPLIASLFALRDQGVITLEAQTLDGLRHAREASVPEGLAEVAQAVIGVPISEPVHPLFLTSDASVAIVVTPEAICDFLGITDNPVFRAESYFVFNNTPDGWQRVCDDDSADAIDSDLVVGRRGTSTADIINLFPILAGSLASKAAMLNNLIRTLAPPPDLLHLFADGLIGREKYDLTRPPQQSALRDTFARLTRPSGVASDAASFASDAQRHAAILRPAPAHQAAVWNALSLLRAPGALYPDAALCFGVAYVFYRAASPEIFGKGADTPAGLLTYALAWANEGFDRYPVLRYRLPSRMPYHELVNRTIGHRVRSACASDIAAALREVLFLPLWSREPNIARIRSTLCG